MKHPRIPEIDESIEEKMRRFQAAEAFEKPIHWLIFIADCDESSVRIPNMSREMAFWNLVNSVPSTQKRRSSHGTRQF